MYPTSFLDDCDPNLADIVILMDASGSVGTTNFEKQKNFVADFANTFDISPNNVQIGVVTFASEPKNEFNLNTFQTKLEVVNAISEIGSIRRRTRTDLALAYVRENSFTADAGDRVDAVNVLVILTDGKSNQPELTKEEADKIHETGAKVFAIGIGGGVDQTELSNIATDDKYVFRIDNFDAFDTLQDVLKKRTCEGKLQMKIYHIF